MDIVQYILGDFWHWLGAFLLVLAFRPFRFRTKNHVGNKTKTKGAQSA